MCMGLLGQVQIILWGLWFWKKFLPKIYLEYGVMEIATSGQSLTYWLDIKSFIKQSDLELVSKKTHYLDLEPFCDFESREKYLKEKHEIRWGLGVRNRNFCNSKNVPMRTYM